ncbi:hypothetical protein GWJ07_12645 [Proteus sp. G2639]|uniref:hypothetical protein n=1 Tax=Proteus TaxID=583 RepID=UPI0013779EA6|nr:MULTISPECIES: hypothetical protein [Proteus]MDM3560525.1 hypothetical protein [Proteus vulgaris]NBM11051.1 hypothetical protein [Proteus sp. G2670]NBM31874.1 hypothetical protein [Proteus sp. G2664]NBN60461.1 hypothetical protein [Proteus sp. G2639]
MKIEYIPSEAGSVAKVVIFSFITERRKLNRLVDRALLFTPVHESTIGFFFRVTTLYGKPSHVLRAYKIICKEANQ